MNIVILVKRGREVIITTEENLTLTMGVYFLSGPCKIKDFKGYVVNLFHGLSLRSEDMLEILEPYIERELDLVEEYTKTKDKYKEAGDDYKY